jgi:hypothetical protein
MEFYIYIVNKLIRRMLRQSPIRTRWWPRQRSVRIIIKEIKSHMEALLEGLRVLWRKDDSLSSILSGCPEKSKSGPEEMEAEVVSF